MNGHGASTMSSKRKASDASDGPPAKRPVNGKLPADDVNGDYDHDHDHEDDCDMSDDLEYHTVVYDGTPVSTGEWQDTVQKVVRNVVSIRFCQTCSFDTDPALTSEASGFVVDAERG